MITKKAGTVLLNVKTKKVALVYRKDGKGLEFPKGHLEEGESLVSCAVRETEEETRRKNHIIDDKELDILKYVTAKGENVELYMYMAIDDGKIDRDISDEDKEDWNWFGVDEVENQLEYQNWKEFWKKIRNRVEKILGGSDGKY